MDWGEMFQSAFDSTMNWLKSDSGANIAGKALEAAGGYLAQAEVAKQQAKAARELDRQRHEEEMELNDHIQQQKDDRSRWAMTGELPFDYTMRGDRGILTGDQDGKLANGVLPRMRG